MVRFTVFTLMFLCALNADAGFRRYPAPAPKKAATTESSPEYPAWIPSCRTVSQTGMTLTLPAGMVEFTSRADAQAYGGLLAKDLSKAKIYRENMIARGVAKAVENSMEVIVSDYALADYDYTGAIYTQVEVNADAPFVKVADGTGAQFFISMLDYDILTASAIQANDKAKKKKKKKR